MSDPLPPAPNPNDPQQYAQQPYPQPYPPQNPLQDPTQYAQASMPLSYMTPSPVPLKPTSVMVIGIIGIILGAFGTLCTPFALVPLFLKAAAAGNPQLAAMQASKPLLAWIVISSVINEGLAILELSASIGSVMLKRWARGAMIIYAIGAIIMAVVGLVVTLAVVVPVSIAAAKSSTGANASAAMGGAIGGAVGGVFGLLFALILPVCILIFFRKPNVVEAFERGATLPPQFTT